MKKVYQPPELQKLALETEEPVTAALSIISNIFTAADDSDLPEITEL